MIFILAESQGKFSKVRFNLNPSLTDRNRNLLINNNFEFFKSSYSDKN